MTCRRAFPVALAAAALAATLLAAWPSLASLTTVAGLFDAGRYAEAREALGAGNEGARPVEEILWRSRLATDPAVALALLEPALQDKRAGTEVRIRVALEIADIQSGRGDYRAAIDALTPLLSAGEENLPGAVHLRAGLALRALGRLQQAREMLASVRPGDPEFVLARYYLGDIGLEQKDATLALRYFNAAAKATDKAGASRLAGGLWRAHRASGEEKEADALVKKLAADDPGSLALLEIRRQIQLEQDERKARAGTEPDNTPVTKTVDATGRYALQLGAFSDRGLALEFLKRYRAQLPDLRIDELRDDRGQYMYKLRTGAYVNPALARSEARQLADRLGIDVIVADLTGTDRPAGN